MQPIKQRQLVAALVGLAAICMGATLLYSAENAVFFPFQWTADYQKVHYTIVLDAGSHGTRANLFKWSGRVEDPSHPLISPVTIPELIEMFAPASAIGISEFAYRPTLVGNIVIAPLIRALARKLTKLGVPDFEWRTIPIFLKATAGMRNVDADSRDEIMFNIRAWLGSSINNPFHFKPDWARVISGEEEGAFGWMSVNTLTGTLLSSANWTIGALDLGGASAQITFMPTHTSVLEGFYELNLGPEILRLYSESFLGYGWGDARLRLSTRLSLESLYHILNFSKSELTDKSSLDNYGRDIVDHKIREFQVSTSPPQQTEANYVAKFKADHPCYPTGYKFEEVIPSIVNPNGRAFLDLDIEAVLSYLVLSGINIDSENVRKLFPPDYIAKFKNRTVDVNERTPLPIKLQPDRRLPFKPSNVPLPKARIQFVVQYEGSGDFYDCKNRAQQLFYTQPCYISTCSFNGVYQPRIADSRFLALGQYSKVRAGLGIPPSATPNTLERAAAHFCSLSWNNISAGQINGEYKPFGKGGVALLCWKATWAHQILTTGFGFDGESSSITYWRPKDEGDWSLSPGWALGSAIAEITYFPWQNGRGRYETPYWWALATCCVLVLLCAALGHRVRTMRHKLSRFVSKRSDVYHAITP